jgi:hypothetical protein
MEVFNLLGRRSHDHPVHPRPQGIPGQIFTERYPVQQPLFSGKMLVAKNRPGRSGYTNGGDAEYKGDDDIATSIIDDGQMHQMPYLRGAFCSQDVLLRIGK